LPYESLKDLPEPVKENLPHHGQEIYKEAFNSALDEYKEEETAHKVAWSAVKKKYEKAEDGSWKSKDS
jgi:cation transport regulator